MHKKDITRFLVATVGIAFLAININILSWQFRIITGGMPGYALTLNYLTGFNIGLFLFLANTIILLLNFILLGKSSGIKGIYGYTLISIIFEISRPILQINQMSLDSYMNQLLLVFIQGLTAPIGITLALLSGYSFGSYSSIYPIVNKYVKKLGAPLFFFIMDGILAVIISLFFGLDKGMLLAVNAITFFYSFKYLMIIGKTFISPNL